VTEPTLGELLETIACNPDPLQSDLTPSAVRLIEHGLAGGRAVLPLLVDPDPRVRGVAERVLEGVVMQRNGWRAGRGYADPHAGQAQTDAMLRAIGYNAEAPAGKRRAAAERWRRWLEEQSATRPD
jgi:hypothetical protein